MTTNREQVRLRLIEHQVKRLQDTYRDLTARREYGQLADFFFHAIYTTRDRSKRDADFKRLYEYFRTKIGSEIVQAIGKLVALNELTDRLDAMVVDRLLVLARTPQFTDRQYEQAYRDGENWQERVDQIRLIIESMNFFHRVAHWPSMGLILKVIRLTARLKGASELGDFLEEGFHAFRGAGDIRQFSAAVEEREMARLKRIWKEYAPDAREAGTRKGRKGYGP